jgi:hypothetical protein
VVEIVYAEPDITLKELARALEETHNVSVHLYSIHRALVRAGFIQVVMTQLVNVPVACPPAAMYWPPPLASMAVTP